MKRIAAIVRRELQGYFVSPIAYAFMTVFLVMTAVGMFGALEIYVRLPASALEEQGWTIRTFVIAGKRGFGFFPWAHMAAALSLPGISMRLLSEERKGGTSELLLTSPLTTWQIVLGKFFGAVSLFLLILVMTAPMMALPAWKANPEWAALGVTYLGLALHGAFILAIGLFASSLTENQFVALIFTLVMLMPFYMLRMVVGMLGPAWDDVIAAITPTLGMPRAAYGVLDSHDVLLWLLYTSGFLFLAGRVLDSGRWR